MSWNFYFGPRELQVQILSPPDHLFQVRSGDMGSIDEEVKRKHSSGGWSLSCFQPSLRDVGVLWPVELSTSRGNAWGLCLFLPVVFIVFFCVKPAALRLTSRTGCQWQPWFYLGLVAHCYIRLSEGPTVTARLGARGTQSLPMSLRLTSNLSVAEPDWHARGDPEDETQSAQRHLSCL